MPLQLIVTKDGSHSIYNSDLNETYHSVGGAIQESQYVYIDCGLKTLIPDFDRVNILEVGFGTGLNAILSVEEARKNQAEILYTTLEPFPLPVEIVEELNYPLFLNDDFLEKKFYSLHSSEWNNTTEILNNFRFTKIKSTLEDYTALEKFHLVYFDAFAPSKQAEIWNIENLRKVFEMLLPGGILITYCSSGKFKRDLKKAGFGIESLPGPLGKREITRAVKN